MDNLHGCRLHKSAGSRFEQRRYDAGPKGDGQEAQHKVAHSLLLHAQTAYSPSMDINARHLLREKAHLNGWAFLIAFRFVYSAE